jgi:hypothetical protein
MPREPFIRIELDQPRKLRFKHRDLRDAVTASGKSIGELYSDAFGGWPYLLLYGLRWQDLGLTLDKCSDFIDTWVDARAATEKTPLDAMGKLLLDALNATGFVRIEAEGKLGDGAEGNAKPEALTT